ncbi:hypothetical protein LSH36_518g02015 [Paralvinella palmiformis]|uniref:Uncharacterized protein n=1 Tax=Paralvinella palmiformis TaxID=53620 RepID=A0AAD9J7H2_9ANNE|nr:hypothetical protein LSH36_518g02015 [Paralvinella palmiformis]
MNTSRLWSEIRKLRGSTKQVTTRNPKEAHTLAKHFATHAASHTLPLRIQRELRDRHDERSSAHQEAIQIELNTDRPFSMYELNNALKSVKMTTPALGTRTLYQQMEEGQGHTYSKAWRVILQADIPPSKYLQDYGEDDCQQTNLAPPNPTESLLICTRKVDY